MKTMLFKHIFMKIKQNYKRFLSLLSMALLGIGFYAGIEACSPDMLKTLDKFYDDIDSWAFQTEMFFLTNRYKQLTDIQKDFLDNQKSVVSDYHLFKNVIFSKMTLDVNNFNKYQKIYHILEEDLPKPNVIIIVNATLETIMKRIKMRNRHFEQNIDPNYLQTLIDSYHEYTALLKENHEEIKVIELNGDELDYVNNPKHLQQVIKKIDEMIGQED